MNINKKLTFPLIFLLSIYLVGCLSNNNSENSTHIESISTSAEETSYLEIEVTPLEHEYEFFSPDDLNNTIDLPLIYLGLKNVYITINQSTYNLETAIRDNHITVPEIFAYARLDSDAGFCQEEYKSINGLTTFKYNYPEFTLQIVYDVYETPDGKQHLINDIAIFNKGETLRRMYTGTDGALLDLEDWGLTFEIKESNSTSVQIKCTHYNGQQLGEIVPKLYYIVTETGKELPTITKNESKYIEIYANPVKQNSSSYLTVDWINEYGELPNGSYKLWLLFEDKHDKEITPLIRNFYDEQAYWINFEIS